MVLAEIDGLPCLHLPLIYACLRSRIHYLNVLRLMVQAINMSCLSLPE